MPDFNPEFERCSIEGTEYSMASVHGGIAHASFEEYEVACKKVPLKPCEFCGGKAKHSPHTPFAIFCTGCGVYGPRATGLYPAVQGWNSGRLDSFFVPASFGQFPPGKVDADAQSVRLAQKR